MALIRDDLQGKLSKSRLTLPASPRNRGYTVNADLIRQQIGNQMLHRVATNDPSLRYHPDAGAAGIALNALSMLVTGAPANVIAHNVASYRHPVKAYTALQHAGGPNVGTVFGGPLRFNPDNLPMFEMAATHHAYNGDPIPGIAQRYNLHPEDLQSFIDTRSKPMIDEQLSNKNPQTDEMSFRHRLDQAQGRLDHNKWAINRARNDLMARLSKRLPGPGAVVSTKDMNLKRYLFPNEWPGDSPPDAFMGDHVNIPFNEEQISAPRLSRDNVPLEAFPKPPPVEQYLEPGVQAEWVRTFRDRLRRQGVQHEGPDVANQALDYMQSLLNRKWELLRRMDADHKARNEGLLDRIPAVTSQEELPGDVRQASTHLQKLAEAHAYGQARQNPHRIIDPNSLFAINKRHAVTSADVLIDALRNGVKPTRVVRYRPTRKGVQWHDIGHDKLLQLYEHLGIDPEGFIPKRPKQ